MLSTRASRGFTLIEILIVIGLIAILAAIVLVAVNPARQFAQANNTQRNSNVNALLNAIGQYIVDHKGAIPASITASAVEMKTGGADICADIVPTYLPSLPVDPKTGSYTDCTSYATGYTVAKDPDNRITVAAPAAELGSTISIAR